MSNKNFSRSDRIVEQIRRELAEIIQMGLKDPRVGMISLTAVEISPDYAHAKVFYTSLAPAEQRPEIDTGLRHAAGFLRRELAHRIRLHTIPELHFVFDSSLETGMRLSTLIDQAVAGSLKDESDS